MGMGFGLGFGLFVCFVELIVILEMVCCLGGLVFGLFGCC